MNKQTLFSLLLASVVGTSFVLVVLPEKAERAVITGSFYCENDGVMFLMETANSKCAHTVMRCDGEGSNCESFTPSGQ